MNGADLYDRIKALQADLEKFPKLALAHVVATHAICSAIFHRGEVDPDFVCDEAVKDIKDELRKAAEIARFVYATRRLKRLTAEIKNPGKRRKKRRRKRRRA